MSEINLKLLQSFLLVARLGSFRKAAEAAHRSTSAISMQIKDLEDQVGMQLFIRRSKRVFLTADGQALFDKTDSAMRDIHNGFQELSDVAASRRATVTIACAPTLASKQIGGAIRSFHKRFPDSAVRLMEAAPAEAITLLEQQVAEFYVGPELTQQNPFLFEELIKDPLMACIPPDFDKGQTEMSFEELGKDPIIILEQPAAIRTLIDDIMRSKSLSLNLAFELQNAFTALSFASAGLGIALLPTIAIGMAKFDGFRSVPFSEPASVRRVGIITSKGYVQNNYSQRLLGLIRGSFGVEA